MKRRFALLTLFALGSAHAGQPLHDVLKLRTIEVLRCEAVTQDNVAEVSRFLRDASSERGVLAEPWKALDTVPGFLIEAVVRRQRDVAFASAGDRRPVKDTLWTNGDDSPAVAFFTASDDADTCDRFVAGTRVNVVLSQRAECDTYPPAGLCVYDQLIRPTTPETWAGYGE